MLNLFRGRGQEQGPQAKEDRQTAHPLPSAHPVDSALPSGIPPEGKAVVTISSQFGSGGSEIGKIVAQESSLLYLDHEIIGEVARRLGVNVEQAARRDERTQGMAHHVLEALQTSSPFTVNLNTLLNPKLPSAHSQELVYWQLTRRVILELATAGDAVIIGRGSQFLLMDRPRTLHFYIFAPLEQRIENVMQHRQLTRVQAVRMVERRDYEHEAYLRRHYGSGQDYPELYHLLINTGLYPFEHAADLIKQTLSLVKTPGGSIEA